MEPKKRYKDTDDYISTFPVEIQNKLKKLRAAIKMAAPEAEEKISYQMPAFYFHGNLVYFAAFKNQIWFYPTASGIDVFKNEFSGFKYSKGAVQFPLDKPLPVDLITRIVKFRVKENLNRATAKNKMSRK
jgi:uncharacterized protein YdhG (YjbR/CyaY superfamily)